MAEVAVSLVFTEPLLGVAALAGLAATAAVVYRAGRVQRVLEEVYPRPSAGRRRLLRGLAIALLLASMALAAFAAAGPAVRVVERVPVDSPQALALLRETPFQAVILVDVSKSMAGERIVAAKRFVESLLAELGPNATVVIYAFAASLEGPLCTGAPADCIASLQGIEAGERYTALGDAIVGALAHARASGLPTAVIVVSDAAWNRGIDPTEAVKSAEAMRVPVIVVAVGGDPRAPPTLKSIEAAGAKVYYAGSPETVATEASKAAADARVEALRLRGETSITLEKLEHIPIAPLALASIALLVAARLLTP